jgi:hypothetical protein
LVGLAINEQGIGLGVYAVGLVERGRIAAIRIKGNHNDWGERDLRNNGKQWGLVRVV